MPRIQHKRGTSANLASVNPTPLAGELVWDSTENAIKIGDGSTAWTSLAYVTATPRSHNHDDRYYTETEVDNLLAGKAASSHTHTFSQISDITFPSPLENNSLVVYTAGVGWGVANDIGTIGVGSQPLGGWPAGSVGASLAGKVDTSDSRLSDARTPTAHKASHATGGSDALTPGDIGAAPAASPTFTGDVTIPDKIVHAGDNSAIRFPADDTVTIETAGEERFRVRSDGNVAVGSGGFSSVRMSVEGAASGYGLYANPTFSSGDPRTARFQASIAANSSVGEFSVVDVNGAIMNSGATVTTAVGLHIRSTLAVGTNNYGIISRVSSGATNYNVYADGTARNYFAGNVGIGASRTTPATALDVNGVITVAAGSAAAPALTISGDSDSGFYQASANLVGIAAAGQPVVEFQYTSAPIVRLGGVTANTNVSVVAPNASGTNQAGGNLAIGGSQGTGTGEGGRIDLSTASAGGSSGTAINARAVRMQVKSNGTVRFVPMASDPTAGSAAGDVYYNSTDNKLRVYNGTSWVDLH